MKSVTMTVVAQLVVSVAFRVSLTSMTPRAALAVKPATELACLPRLTVPAGTVIDSVPASMVTVAVVFPLVATDAGVNANRK